MTLFILKAGNKIGPLTVDQVATSIRKGEFLMVDLAWHEGSPDWIPLSAIKEVTDATLPPAPAGVVVTAPGTDTQPISKDWAPTQNIVGGLILIFVSLPLFWCYFDWEAEAQKTQIYYQSRQEQKHAPDTSKHGKNPMLFLAVVSFGYGVKRCIDGIRNQPDGGKPEFKSGQT